MNELFQMRRVQELVKAMAGAKTRRNLYQSSASLYVNWLSDRIWQAVATLWYFIVRPWPKLSRLMRNLMSRPGKESVSSSKNWKRSNAVVLDDKQNTSTPKKDESMSMLHVDDDDDDDDESNKLNTYLVVIFLLF